MIPRANITAWRSSAPWPADNQIEQDLVLSRTLVEMFRSTALAASVAFRGGTALHKLFFDPPGRYSEDIDLVQRDAGPIGQTVDELRRGLDPWLGPPKWKAGQGRFTIYYHFTTTFEPVQRARLKIEIDTREHFSVHGFARRSFEVSNPWFSGSIEIPTYTLDELLGTKLRALYQRKKGRDLLDLRMGLDHPETDPEAVVDAFARYMAFGKTPVSRAQYESNMAEKLSDEVFLGDVPSLLRTGVEFDAKSAWDVVHPALVARLPGEPWKGRAG